MQPMDAAHGLVDVGGFEAARSARRSPSRPTGAGGERVNDDMEDFECPCCGFKFNVIWQVDAMTAVYGKQVEFCPRCGEYLEDNSDG
jgi:hypothetical protein